MSNSSTCHPSPLAIMHFMPSMVATFRNAISAETHQHHAAQITLDFEGEFELHCQEQVQHCKCVLIPPNLSHCVRSNNHWQVTILLDTNHSLTKRLLKVFMVKNSPVEIPEEYYRDLLLLGISARNDQLSISQLSGQLRQVFEKWTEDVGVDEQDVRIESLLNSINANTSLEEVDRIVANVPLSKSRLSHLFVEQAGITLRRYILWQRLRRAIAIIVEGQSITDAAYDASFSDLPHLSRTFKSMFGINISMLFQIKKYIHIHVE